MVFLVYSNILSLNNPKAFGYISKSFYLCIPNTMIMEIRYITDTDFLPKELTHFHGLFPNEITDDLYQIVYGAFRSCYCMYDIYNLVVLFANRQVVFALKKYKLNSWKKSLKAIVKKIESNSSNDFKVVIFIPLVSREMVLSEAIDYFQMAIFTIDEILSGNDCPIQKDFNAFPSVPDMKELFEDTYSFLTDPFIDTSGEQQEDVESGLKRLAFQVFKTKFVTDEMYRRGIDSITINNEEVTITPSEFYHDANKYKETFIEKNKVYEPTVEELGATVKVTQPLDSFDPSSEFVKVRSTVMFHMLSSILNITMENKYQVMALFNYAVGKVYDIKRPKQETRDNAVRKYVDDCIAGRLPTGNTLDFCQSVKKRLIEYGFDVPAIIEEGAEIKRHDKLT